MSNNGTKETGGPAVQVDKTESHSGISKPRRGMMVTKRKLAIQKARDLFGENAQIKAPKTSRVIESHRKLVVNALKDIGKASFRELSAEVALSANYRRFAVASLVMTGHVIVIGAGKYKLANSGSDKPVSNASFNELEDAKREDLSQKIKVLEYAIRTIEHHFCISILPCGDDFKRSDQYLSEDLLFAFLDAADKVDDIYGDYMRKAVGVAFKRETQHLFVGFNSIRDVAVLSNPGIPEKIRGMFEGFLHDENGSGFRVDIGLSGLVNKARANIRNFISETFTISSDAPAGISQVSARRGPRSAIGSDTPSGAIRGREIHKMWHDWEFRLGHIDLDWATFDFVLWPLISGFIVHSIDLIGDDGKRHDRDYYGIKPRKTKV
jgi:hypothetical protein